MDKRHLGRIKAMRRYCRAIASSINRFGNSPEKFKSDWDYYNSVSMSLMQIGELIGGLPDEFKAATKEQVSWSIFRGMRNRFAHTYESMDNDNIWETATEDVPALLVFCNELIAKEESSRAR